MSSGDHKPVSYDFRQPRRLADDIETILMMWQKRIASQVADRWTQNLACTAPWEPKPLETTRSSSFAASVREQGSIVCFEIGLGPDRDLTWLMIPRQLALAIVSTMLGETIEELPEDRSLTDVESSLLELAAQEFEHGLIESQPCDESLRCEVLGTERFQLLTRRFPETEPLVVAGFELNGSFGAGQVYWLLSQNAVLKFATHMSECRVTRDSNADELEETVKKIPLQVVVKLGRASVHVSDLMNLQEGDVIILDQRVSDPLSAEVAGTTKFRGWPGRVGSRQAYQISMLFTPEDE